MVMLIHHVGGCGSWRDCPGAGAGRKHMKRMVTAGVAGLLVVAQLVGIAGQASAQDDQPEEVEQQAPVETPSLQLSGPTEAVAGEIIDFVVFVPDATTAIEAVVDFDKTALDFGGIYSETDRTQLLQVTNQPDRVSIGAYRCATASCDSALAGSIGPITIRFAVIEPGVHQIRVARAHAVSSGGTEQLGSVSTTVTVAGEAADGGDATSGTTGPDLATDRGEVTSEAADLTADGAVTGADVTELALAWEDVRRRREPCTLDSGRLSDADVDGSGCIDIADLAAIAAKSAPAAASRQALRLDLALAATPMVVNSTSDEWDANLNNGVCNTPSGVCSLRAAILQANANPGPDIINFNIPGSGPHRITLGSQLPTISDTSGALIIDGYTQPGASANTSEQVSNASIRIELRGPGYNGRSAMVVTSPNNTIRGLAIYRTFSNIRLTGAGATGNRIVGNFIGTDANGSYEIPGARNEYIDQSGVEIGNGASSNRIGTPALADRNVISGNPYSGVRINHANTKGNLVQNNLVGLTPNGSDSLYTYVAGIDVQWGANETIVGGYEDHAGNVVTGNTNYGIDLSHSSKNNRIVGNYLGTDVTGSRVRSDTGNLIGLAIKDNTVGNLVEHNVIGGNRWDGIWHRHNFTGGNTFRYNRIGVGVDGSNIGNSRYGMHLSGHDDVYEKNIFANNGSYGVYISNYNGGNGFSPPQYTERNRISANSFYGNGSTAIYLTGAHNNIASPQFTSLSTGNAGGTACGGCRVEIYVASGSGGRQFIAATTASSNGSWSISDGAISNNSVIALAISASNDTSRFSTSYNVGSRPGNSAPTIAAINDRSGQRYGFVQFPVQAGDPNGNFLTYSALGLPAGVSIDQRSGVISGRPGSVGQHTVWVRVDDGATAVQRSFNWTVGVPNRAPTINSVGDQSGTVGQAVSLTVTGSDPDGQTLTFSAAGLPNGLSIAGGGQITGTPSQAGSFNVTATVRDPVGATASTSFTWSISPGQGGGYTCSVSGNTLSWTDDGASRYYIRQLLGGVDRYIGSSTGLSLQLTRPAGTYTVRHWLGGRPVDATCDAGAVGEFSCSVNGNTLSWTDDGASRYYIRQIIGGVDRYVASSTGLSYQLNNPGGTYKVRHWLGPVAVDATCDA